MQIKVVSPDDKHDAIECLDDDSFQIVEGNISLEEMANDLSFVKPNSACGLVNTLNEKAVYVLRSLEHVGWKVDWPEVDGADDEEDTDPGVELDVN
ncbi:TPA: hypothetical protein MB364_000879 [Klebsiella variicola subsp. variicola]|nr:hypothetical protein [Klebsiella variicola subsp. variicola]